MEDILVIQNLSKHYGDQVALDSLSLKLKKGEIYGLIGQNGAGKSTLIKLITQIIAPSQGTVSILGSRTPKEWTTALQHVGSVIETPVAHQHLSAYDNLRFYCLDRGIKKPDSRIKETLDYVGLSQTGTKKFRDFSLGMKQRLGIAIAILSRPDLLILDEPINGLDPVGIQEFREMVLRLNRELGMTLLFLAISCLNYTWWPVALASFIKDGSSKSFPRRTSTAKVATILSSSPKRLKWLRTSFKNS